MLKINRDGIVSDSADVAALRGKLSRDEAEIRKLEAGGPFTVEGGIAGPEGLEVLKVPAEGAAAEAPAPVTPPAPPAPPRTPPRRPPAVPRE
jgi:hypothetical protein